MTWLDWYRPLDKPALTPAPFTTNLLWTIPYLIILVCFGLVFAQVHGGRP